MHRLEKACLMNPHGSPLPGAGSLALLNASETSQCILYWQSQRQCWHRQHGSTHLKEMSGYECTSLFKTAHSPGATGDGKI